MEVLIMVKVWFQIRGEELSTVCRVSDYAEFTTAMSHNECYEAYYADERDDKFWIKGREVVTWGKVE
jgi:hypothetical protein